jgi:DNA-binding response OmpR family regulator
VRLLLDALDFPICDCLAALPSPPGADGEAARQKQAAHHKAESLRLVARILVVEDDYLVGLNSESALAEAGYQVVAVVPSGEEALQIAAELHPELVLMDIRLAGAMDGIDAAMALRKENVPVLYASAHSDEPTRLRGEEAKPLGWLTKPFSDAQLIAAVQAALRRIRTS